MGEDYPSKQRIKYRKRKEKRRRRKVFIQKCCIISILVLAGVSFANRQGYFSNVQKENNSLEAVEVREIQDYPDSLSELVKKNPETKQFVKDYKKEHSKKHTINLKKEVIKGKVPLFLQWDERWGYENYGSDMMAITGCGPTCLSMVLCGITGDSSWSPLKVAKFAQEEGYYEEGAGSRWALMTEGAKECGLQATEIPLDESRMRHELENGNPIICIMGPGDFTTAGHYIVLYGVNEMGEFLVHDPNSKKRSKRTWLYDDISSQIRNLWVYNM